MSLRGSLSFESRQGERFRGSRGSQDRNQVAEEQSRARRMDHLQEQAGRAFKILARYYYSNPDIITSICQLPGPAPRF